MLILSTGVWWPIVFIDSWQISGESLFVEFGITGRLADRFEKTASKLADSASGGDTGCMFDMGVHKPKLAILLVESVAIPIAVLSDGFDNAWVSGCMSSSVWL